MANHAPGMSAIQLALAGKLAQEYPAIVKAAEDFRDHYVRTGEKYFTLCKTVRDSKLAKKAATALLLGLGFPKSRASEIITVSAVSDELWAKYSAQSVGFKATLKLANPKPEVPPSEQATQGGETETETETAPAPRAKPVKIHDITDENVKAALREVVTVFNRPLKGGEKTEWAYAHRLDGVNYYFAITASPVQ